MNLASRSWVYRPIPNAHDYAMQALATGYDSMRNVYLAIAAIAVGVALLSEERHFNDDEQGSMFAYLVRSPAAAMPDKLQVGDPVEPLAATSTR